MKLKSGNIITVVVLAGFFLAVVLLITKQTPHLEKNQIKKEADGFKNIAYYVDSESVRLNNGVAIKSIEGSSSRTITKYFGNDLTTDLNHDGLDDVVFLITQNSGGSGTFYYVVVALATNNGFVGTNAVLLGDRVAPQNINFSQEGYIVVNYADRKKGESMTTLPSVGVSKYFRLLEGQIVEISKLGEDVFSINYPRQNTVVKSPLMISGDVIGTWFFEGSFSISLTDYAGHVIASGPASAMEDWMTKNKVGFNSNLIFDRPKTETGFLIFRKDNASGLPEHDQAIAIPIRFR